MFIKIHNSVIKGEEPSQSSLRDASSPEGGAPSQALPRQLSQRESQAVKFIAKVLGVMRKLPAALLPLPLGEVSPQVTERAHAVSPVAKVSSAIRNLPTLPKAPPSGELARERLRGFAPLFQPFAQFQPPFAQNFFCFCLIYGIFIVTSPV